MLKDPRMDGDRPNTPLEQADVSLSNCAQALLSTVCNLESQLARVLRPTPPEAVNTNSAVQPVGPVRSELVARFAETRELIERTDARLLAIMERLDV